MPDDQNGQETPDYAALAKQFGGTVAATPAPAASSTQTVAPTDAPVSKAPAGASADVASHANYNDLVKQFGGTIAPTATAAPPQSTIGKLFTGPNTVLGSANEAPTKEASTEISGASDILHGNVRQGLGKIWDSERPHVIPGSPLEKFIQKVNPDFKGEGAHEEIKSSLAKPPVDAAQFVDKKKHPMGKAIAEAAQSFVSPQMLATMVATGGMGMVESPQALGMASRLVSAGFAGDTIANAYKHMKAFKEAYDAGDAPEAEYQLTHAVLSGAMSTLATQHATTKTAPGEAAAQPWTKAGAAADAALGRAASKVSSAIPKMAAALIPDKTPEATPAEHLEAAADNLYKAIKPGKGLVADDFRTTLKDAMPQLSVIANKNPNVETPVDMAEAIENHRNGIESQLKAKAADMRGLPQARMEGVETEIQNALNEGWNKAERKYSPDEIEKASSSVMKMLGLETKMAKDPNTGEMTPTVNRVAPTPDLYGAENIRQRFKEDSTPAFGEAGKVPSAEVYAKAVANRALREAIDQKFEDLGVEGVQEWRRQEAGLIDVRDALRDAAKRSEDAGKWSVWKGLTGRKGWGAMPAIAGAVLGGAPGAIIGELSSLGADWWRDQQENPNVLTRKALERMQKAGPSKEAAIPTKPGGVRMGRTVQPEGFGEVENPNKGAAATTPAPEIVHGGSKEGINEAKLRIGDEDMGALYFTHKGENASVNSSWLDEGERGKGYGQKLILEAANKAQTQGAKFFTSDAKGETSPSAASAWKALQKKGYPVDVENGIYRLDLSQPNPTSFKLQKTLLERLPETVHYPGEVMDDIHHELGHALVGDSMGLGTDDGIRSDRHPDNRVDNTAASVSIDLDPWGATKHGIDYDKVVPHIHDFLTLLMGGGAGEEAFSGTPMESNAGMKGDIHEAHSLLSALGYTYDDAVAKIEAAKNRAREVLTQPGFADIVKKYSGQREEDLPTTHHMSKERVAQIAKEIKDEQSKNSGQGNAPRVGGGTEERSERAVARTESGRESRVGQSPTQLNKKTEKPNYPLAGALVAAGGLGALAGLTKKEEKPAVKTQELQPTKTAFKSEGRETDIPSLIDRAATDNGIPQDIFRAQARQESGLNPRAISKKGAKGVMQLMDPTAKALGVQDSFDPVQNIAGGAKLMAQLHNQFGRWDRALAAYNWSPDRVQNAVDKWGDNWLDHTPEETKNYVRAILKGK